MNIGKASIESGLSPKAIRYYESIKLVIPERRDNNYRDYSAVQVQSLQLIRQARGLGFSVEQCRDLLALRQASTPDERQAIETKLLDHLQDIDSKLEHLQRIRETLTHMMALEPVQSMGAVIKSNVASTDDTNRSI